MAEIYANFSQALRESERPANLGVDALKDYEQQLADAAHPLEEKAIAVHEKNLELIRRGLNNAWTQKSLDHLAALKPDTYARAEISSGFLGSLERYVYQPPPRAVEAALGNPTAPEGAPTPATPPGRRPARSDRPSQREQAMQTRTDLERTKGARQVAAGLVLARGLLGCSTTASAGKPRVDGSTLQPDAWLPAH